MKVAEYLQTANYSFLYYCRSTPPKSDKTFTQTDAEHIIKMKLACHFMNKGYYFHKITFKDDTELIISNRQYNQDIQFEWTHIDDNIL